MTDASDFLRELDRIGARLTLDGDMQCETIEARERVVIHFAEAFERLKRRRLAAGRTSGDAA